MTALLSVATLCGLPCGATGQTGEILLVGDRVRVAVPPTTSAGGIPSERAEPASYTTRTFVGVVRSFEGDTVTYMTESGDLGAGVPVRIVQASDLLSVDVGGDGTWGTAPAPGGYGLQVARTRVTHSRRALGIGATVGMLGGLHLAEKLCPETEICIGQALGGALIGAGVGALVGLGVGSRETHVWRRGVP
ncbi:MAG TPA: hypothetical protein VMM83_05375, partial [Longimicrobiales bacterium]|nr:hypothetical protein [Longimicrobiales bacterium]